MEITNQEFNLFRVYIEEVSGISLEEEKTYLIESRLKGLLDEFGCHNYGDLYRKAKENASPLLRNKIVDAITTNETLWFRDKGPYVVFEQMFLPEMVRQIAAGKSKVRIWSAACSTGQEPYSLAMGISEFLLWHGNGVADHSHFEIFATDISSQALSVGELGAYDQLSMGRGLSDAYKMKYFKQTGRFSIIDSKIKKMVEFKEFNLLNDFGALGTFDAIFCRNVAIYFSHDVKVQLFEKLRNILRPGGIFIVGTSETLSYYSKGFKGMEFNNYPYYVS
ncbi:MAG: protein-glutamate O-methyltransferase CheR [SAR324 cluster bacterium]|nr:protein-glutamate O-methyltransferase CheR [SAR324 cluster bacterium]